MSHLDPSTLLDPPPDQAAIRRAWYDVARTRSRAPLVTPKLTNDDVRAIRARFDAGDPIRTIAPDFAIDQSYVWKIGRRLVKTAVPEAAA